MDRKTYGSAAALLIATRQFLLDHHWGQNAFRRIDEEGRLCYCLMGAMDQAGVNMKAGVETMNRAHFWLVKALGNHSPIAWNDTPGREKGEVMNLLDKAIKMCNIPENA